MVRGNKYLQNTKKVTSFILCVTIALMGLFNIPACAVTYPMMGEISSTNGEAKIYSLAGTTGHEAKPEDKNKSKLLITLKNGDKVKVLGEAVDGDGDKWYQINYGENFANTGYAVINKVVLKYEYEFDEDFEKNLQNFPESYRDALRSLHAKYPNWKFVANTYSLTFKAAVEAQYSVKNVTDTRKWVEYNYFGEEWLDIRAKNVETGTWLTPEPRWTYASRAAIEYYMDPRNSLNEDMIFAFMQQSYQEDEKIRENLITIIKGTFLENGYDKDGDGKLEGDTDKNAYIEDLIAAAKESKVSPYVLAATIIVEQGAKGESNLISGKYPGYEGCYNFFNFAASGSSTTEIAVSGLTYAKNNGWTSRKASIIGGAKKYSDGYISIGQDTYYYKDFNIVKEDWTHQYATALYDAWTNAKYLKKGCTTSTDAVIIFSIPVFADMPDKACPLPGTQGETGGGNSGNNSGNQTPTTPAEPVIKKGDVNGDGKISIVDHAAVKRQLLGVKNLEGVAIKAADINGDGKVSVVDLAAIKRHLLGVKPIS